MPKHLFKSHDGHLYDTRNPQWSTNAPLRRDYSRGFQTINTVSEFKATLRAGRYTDLGGYPLYFICTDSAALCFACARKEFRQIADSIRNGLHDGWRVAWCDINYEDSDLTCDHCSARIESAYGND
jgi:hypothetical protein